MDDLNKSWIVKMRERLEQLDKEKNEAIHKAGEGAQNVADKLRGNDKQNEP